MFRNRERISSLEAFQPIFSAMRQKDPDELNRISEELAARVIDTNKTLLDESAGLENYHVALERQKEVVQAFSSQYLNTVSQIDKKKINLQQFAPLAAELYFDTFEALIDDYLTRKKDAMHRSVEKDKSWYAGMKDGARKSGILVNYALRGINHASQSLTGDKLVANTDIVDNRTMVEKLFSEHLDVHQVGRDLNAMFDQTMAIYKRNWSKRIDEQKFDLKAFNSFAFASQAANSMKFDLQLGIAEQTLAVGLGSAVVGSVGLAAGWHTITYALLNVFPPIAIMAAIASAGLGFVTQDAVVNQRKRQIDEQLDNYKGRFLSLLDHEPMHQLGDMTVRKYINFCNQQIVDQACRQWEKVLKFSVEDFDRLNEAAANHLQYLEEAKEDVYEQKTRNRIEAQHKADRVSFANERALTDSEIREMLSNAFYKARQEIDIVSPWISNWVFQAGFSSMFEAALKRGVTIKIVYGMTEDNSIKNKGNDKDHQRNDNTRRNAGKLEHNYDRYVKRGLLKVRFGNTHSKLLICDDVFYAIGSYNWLSFKGDYTDENTRGETAQYSENPAQLEEWRQKIFNF